MKRTKMLAIIVLALMAYMATVGEAAPIGTAWTYQGRLMDDNNPADGVYDFLFILFNEPNGTGYQIPLTNDINDIDVIDGYFTVELDYGSDVFNGDARWLEILVRPGDSSDVSDYVTLSPRQEVSPTPYSLYAENARTDNDWIVSGNDMYSIPSGKVGIGTTSPIASLEVISPVDVHAIRATTNYIPVYALRTSTVGTWPAMAGDCNSEASSASGVRGRILSTSPGSLSAGVYGYNYGTGSNGVGVRGYHDGAGAGVYGRCDSVDGRGVHGHSNSGKGVYGECSNGFGVYGCSSSDAGIGVWGRHNTSGNFGYLADVIYGVHGCSNSGRGVFGHSNSGYGVYGECGTGIGVYGQSATGYAGYFSGDVYVVATMSAGAVIDRTPYPKDLATAYEAVMSMERLPDGQYDENNKEAQLDHSMLSDFIRSKDGNRDLSATVSCHNEVLKDLIRKQQELGKAHIYIEQLHERIEAMEEKLVKLEAVLNPLQ